MTPEQREAAERLVADQSSSNLEWSRQVVALLRELLAEPQGEPVAHRITQWGFCPVCRHDRIPGEGCAQPECPDAIAVNCVKPQGEPVAHLYVGGDYGDELQDWEIDAEQGMCDKLNEQYYGNPQKLPLYTHPPQQRRPLTPSMQAEVECDCLVAWNASTYGHSAQDTVHPMFLSAFVRGYRAAERAHGIGETP